MDRLTEEQRERISGESVSWAQSIAERYARVFPEHREEFESSANWGAVRAARTYVPERGGVWDRWLKLCVKGEIQDYLDSAYVRRHSRLTDEQVNTIAAKEEVKLAEGLEDLLEYLPERHRELCLLVYQEDLTPSAAGRALGVSGKQGRIIHKQALERLRREIAA